MGGHIPPQPDYVGSALTAGVPVGTTTNPHDVWGLGDLYGQKIFQGLVPVPGTVDTSTPEGIAAASRGDNIHPGIAPDSYSTTQALMKHVADLWASQQEEKAQYPHRLTSYEQLQRSLWQAGFFGQTSIDDVHVGQWTTQTEQALVGAIGQYEQVSTAAKLPITFAEFLNQNAVVGQDGGKNSPSGSQASPPPSIHISDPQSIRDAAQSAAMDALGRGLSSDQLDRFVAQFQAAQVSAGQASRDGANTVADPVLGDQAAAFAQGENPRAYKQNQRQSYLDSLVNLLGPPVDRPSITPTPSAEGS